MSALACPRCQRVNPTEARFCYYDGVELRAAVAASRELSFNREFLFPSGRRCKTYDEFVRTCSVEWDTARRLLRQGDLERFFAGMGRMDLAMAARNAAASSDADLALDQFLLQLPCRNDPGPKLELGTRRIQAGLLKRGETRRFTLSILNAGTRLLSGTMSLEDAYWLRFGDNLPRQLPFRVVRELQQPVEIDTSLLVAGQKYVSTIRIESNGGTYEVPVQLQVAVVPFPHAPFAGARSGRELAVKMRDLPKEAVPLFAKGLVEEWFTANGWRYPVQGPTAKGIGAVQQFFEGLGLSRTPKLQLSASEVTIACSPTETSLESVQLSTTERKWVFARISSDVPWLVPLEADLAGPQRVSIGFSVAPDLLGSEQVRSGKLHITANGGQRFEVTVHAQIRPVHESLGTRLIRGLCIGILAAGTFRLLISLPDLWIRPSQFGGWLSLAQPEHLTAYLRSVTLALGWLGIPLGAVWLWRSSGPRDALAGAITGGVATLILSVTFAASVVLLDSVLAPLLPSRMPGAAIASWTLVGMVLGGVLSLLGRLGRRLLRTLASPFTWLFRRLGAVSLADFLRPP
jgi:hypothetical protein